MSFADTLLPEFDQEMRTTRALLERVPLDRAEWKPHTKSTNLGALAGHIAGLAGFGEPIVSGDSFDVAARGGAGPTVYASTTELLAAFDANVARTREQIAALKDANAYAPWTLRNGEHVVFTLPRAAVFRTMLMNHIVHHRGQLSVYLRLNDVPLPSIYGPTADT